MKSHSQNIFRTSITGSDNNYEYFCFFQEISSPNFPSNYPPNINCRWVLVAPSTSKIHLHFLSINMEGSNLCSKDSLTIADASSKIPVRHEVNSSMIVSSDRNRNHANRWFRVSFVKSFWNLVWISFIFLYLPFSSFLRCSFFAFSFPSLYITFHFLFFLRFFFSYSYWFSFSLIYFHSIKKLKYFSSFAAVKIGKKSLHHHLLANDFSFLIEWK